MGVYTLDWVEHGPVHSMSGSKSTYSWASLHNGLQILGKVALAKYEWWILHLDGHEGSRRKTKFPNILNGRINRSWLKVNVTYRSFGLNQLPKYI